MVSLDSKQQEYLLHAIESAHSIASLREFFLWSQGALQTLLPHRVLLCAPLDEQGRARSVECLHSAVLAPAQRALLADPLDGPMPAWLRAWRDGGGQPLALEAGGEGHALVHGSGPLPGGGSAFVLLGQPAAPDARAAWLLQLLLPYMHLGLQRSQAGRQVAAPGPALSRRQAEIVQWLREGKSNEEIGRQLGISALTVKCHLQRLYRQLGVSNRAHAVARSIAHLHG